MDKTKIFVDLDDTLIKTSELKSEMMTIISYLGVPLEVAKQRYEQSKDENGIPRVDVLSSSFLDGPNPIEPNYLKSRLETMYATIDEKNLLTEIMVWLEDRYPRETHEYILITKGEDHIQERKMRTFNLAALFDRAPIVVKTHKADALREMGLVQPGERFIMVDDKKKELEAIQESFPSAELLIVPSEGDPQYFEREEGIREGEEPQEPSRREG